MSGTDLTMVQTIAEKHVVMIEICAPPLTQFSLFSSPKEKLELKERGNEKKKRTKIISLGEIKHLVSLLDKWGKKALSVILGRICVCPIQLTSLQPQGSLQTENSSAGVSLQGLTLRHFTVSKSVQLCNLCVLSRTAMLQLFLKLDWQPRQDQSSHRLS